MAISYDDASTGIFTHIGKLIKYLNAYEGWGDTDLPAGKLAILNAFQAGDMDAAVDGLVSDYDGFITAIDGWRSRLADRATKRLQDETSVVNELNLPSSAIDDILFELSHQMSRDSKTIDRSTATVGTITAVAGNIGNGTILVSKVLDGYSRPGFDMSSHPLYNGVDSELVVPAETMTFTCVTDSQRNGVPEGAESFDWSGEIGGSSPFSLKAEGSGRGPAIQVLNASTLISNGSFENTTLSGSGYYPNGWTTTGTVGTHINRDTGNVYRGTYSLKFSGDGAQANIQVLQAFTISRLRPKKRYCCSIRYKASGVPAAGNILVHCTGTGYTASSSEKVDIAAGSFSTSWAHAYFFINLPDPIPTDFSLIVKIGSTLSNGTHVYFDSLAFGEVSWHGGLGAVAIAGSTRFMAGDKFTCAVSNNGAGVFQEFFRRYYRRQLPSSGSPNIADSLAT